VSWPPAEPLLGLELPDAEFPPAGAGAGVGAGEEATLVTPVPLDIGPVEPVGTAAADGAVAVVAGVVVVTGTVLPGATADTAGA
jgi:hypothetical protein